MEALGASDSRAQLSECNQDVALSPKKKRKVGNHTTVAETKKMYFTIQVHYGSNNDKRILTHLNFAHIIHSALNSMFGIVGEALYPYKVVSYDPQTQLGTVETLAEKGKQSKFRSAITMYGGPYLNMPVRMDVMLISEKFSDAGEHSSMR